MTPYKDTLTTDEINRLKAFWAVQEVLKRDWEPFTQADLIFEADQDAQPPANPSLASQEPSKHHWHYDDHQYQAQGVEPPTTGEVDEDGSFYQGVVNLVGFTVAGGIFVWALLAYGLPMFVKGLLWWLGV